MTEIMMDKDMRGTTRRGLLLGGMAGIGAVLIKVEPSAATPDSMKRAIHQVAVTVDQTGQRASTAQPWRRRNCGRREPFDGGLI